MEDNIIKNPSMSPADDQVFSITMLCRRWNCTPLVASRRLKEHNVRILRFNGRVHAVLLSEIMRLERKLTQKPGVNYFHGRRPIALQASTLPPTPTPMKTDRRFPRVKIFPARPTHT
jgi:hypothetical protein